MRNMKGNFEKRERSKKEKTEYCSKFFMIHHRLKDNYDGRGHRCIFCDRLPSQCINPKYLN